MTFAWGRIEVEGLGTFRDTKVFPGEPGIQPADVAELLDHGATTVVFSQGMLSRLHVNGAAYRISVDDWKTAACPHGGPSLALSAAGTYHATWFASVDPSIKGVKTAIQMRFSRRRRSEVAERTEVGPRDQIRRVPDSGP